MATNTQATLDDLYHVPEHGKTELVHGELITMAPMGFLPGRAGGEIYASLRRYERQTQNGYAIPDNVGFSVTLPHRSSFSPDAAFYTGQVTGMKFLVGAPVFAAEVRSEHDYGEHAEKALAAKCADYFAAGTVVVWDVDLLHDHVIHVYRATDPRNPTICQRGEVAEAEPAVLGWRMTVDELFS